ncbi:MAG: lspA [Armatimonadetes bacterium]|nr:lspA [Armatimonadota bacterium]
MRYAFWVIAALVVALDQWTKHLVQMSLPLHRSVPVIPGVVSLTFTHNPGVAFGQFAGGGPLLIAAALGAVLGIIIYRSRLLRRGIALHPVLLLGLALPMGGALGNVADRIRIGQVVDFIDFGWWPVFNVADTAISLGAVALVCYFSFINPPDPEPVVEPRAAGECGNGGA